ncbi:Calx-beta domain-containing protein [Vacuolonema iberomarrocanum]|uniref:Calx-beta domain-containing protein n=1 Tax=Vacuolonema iberomarrocanum TaxID=3454632 RepID=UPI003F6E3BF5
MPFEPIQNLSILDGNNGFVINGVAAGDGSGFSVSGAGDINGDGIDDLIIGASNADPDGNISAGTSYVVFGNQTGFGANFDLSTLNGSNGFAINGVAAGDYSGRSVSGAGDINGDGINDLIIGAFRADPNGNSFAGTSYVVFGRQTGFGANFDLSTLNGSNGFPINGVAAGDGSGRSVSGAGDINGDGIDDLIIGAYRADPDGNIEAGTSYVVFGRQTGFGASLDASALNGSNGFAINGVAAGDSSGGSVSGAGDVNGDGIDDLIIGASGADPNGNSFAGTSYVVFGNQTGFGASLDPSALNGSNGFAINGVAAGDSSGFSVSGAGDINGDGIDDLIIGAGGADPNGNSVAGTSYVVFGNQTGFGASLDLSTLNGSNGFAINGVAAGDGSGISVSSAGDINSDGIDDLIIGAFRTDLDGNIDAGTSYVVFGNQTGFGASLDLSTLNGSNGFAINGVAAGDNSGRSVSGAGDINGDGIDDLIIGAYGADPNGNSFAGTSYVVFGRPVPRLRINNAQVNEGDAGTTAARFTVSLSKASNQTISVDFTVSNATATGGSDYTATSGTLTIAPGDTTATFIVNVLGDTQPEVDETFVVTLSNPTNAVLLDAEGIGTIRNDDPTPGDDNLTGTNGRDVIFALAGNDIVNGLGGSDRLAGEDGNDRLLGGDGNDRLIGGAGNDRAGGGSGNDRILGGNGRDRLIGNAGNDRLIGGNGNDALLGGVGNDTLIGGAGNDRLLGAGGNDLMRGNLGNDTLNGGAGVDRQFGGAGRDRLNGQGGNDVLRGGLGDDALRGGAGNDRLLGEAGNDLIETGVGRDRIVIRPGQGFDRVTDFADGQDLIVLGGIQFGQLTLRQQGNDVRVSRGGESLLLLQNLNVGQLSQADFV